MNFYRTLLFGCFLFLTVSLAAQLAVRYDVSLDHIRQHEAVITVEFPALPPQPLEIIMPSSSPGRYAVHHFAKNVYAEKAYDADGNQLPLQKTDIDRWEVSGHQGYVKFQYTLFANHGDGTYSGIDNRKLHLNMPSAFVFAPVAEKRPIELHFDLSKHPDWSVATQLKPLSESAFWAPNYYYFFDSPTMVGAIDFRRWTSDSNGKTYTIEIAAMHEGTDEELNDYTEWVRQVVEAQKAVYGGLPDFDFGRYTFLVSYNPWINGDGMEHRNSTVCSSKGNLANNASGLIGTISHEFFHAWNVERIRPKSLEPFDFTRANMSGELWFAEGFTSYYDDLILRRTGIYDEERYRRGLIGTLNYVLNSPGRQSYSPIGMSQRAPFVDAASSIDEHNTANIFVSYYPYGAVIGLALDLSLRQKFEAVTLDDLMKYLWEHYGKTEVPYQVPDLQNALAEVCGDADFAESFFANYIYKSELPDFGPLFAQMGWKLELANPDQSDLAGLNLDFSEEGVKITGGIVKGHSLYTAGVQSGDFLLTLNGTAVSDEEAWKKILSELKIGKNYAIQYRQNGLEESGEFTLVQDPRITLEVDEKAKKTAASKRAAWLGGE
ncbi:M61 family metallopeptidase [Flavilitoribacter nigricans]|nr:M61 family metallopeptidase [Flavilitoribacter nigricans]